MLRPMADLSPNSPRGMGQVPRHLPKHSGSCPILLLGLLLLSIPASATSPSWSETLDIAVSTAPPRLPVMLCVVDTAGQAQCHHRDGILTCRPGAADGAVCPGGAKRLLSSCQDASPCVFGAVPVPPDAFGLLLLELHPLCLVCHVTLWWRE